MKVVILGTAHPFRGGLAVYNERLARAFAQAGDEVSIYTFSMQYPSFLFPGKTQFTDQPKPADLDIHVRVNSVNPFNWLSVGREISRLKPDLLIVKFWLPFMGPCFGTINRLVRKNGHTRIVTIIDNMIPHEKRIGDKAFSKYFVKSVDAFVTMSESVLNDVKLFDTQKPKLYSPHPIYDNFGTAIPKAEARYMLGLDTSGKYILFFGLIRDYKGLDILLHVMADERLRSRGVKLLVAGEFYGNEELYTNMIRDLGIGDRVILKGDFIPDPEVGRYFSAADMVVQPYKRATQSGVTQICYQFDKPMLVTRVGGLPGMVPDGLVGYVVQPEADAIAAAITNFYDKEREAEFAAHVQQEKKKYGWDVMVQKLKSFAGRN